MSSDLTTALALAKAALEGALANVEINLELIESDVPGNPDFVSQTRQQIASLETSLQI